MSDQEKIERVKEIVSKWALDDNSNALTSTVAFIEIMEVLDFDPYESQKT